MVRAVGLPYYTDDDHTPLTSIGYSSGENYGSTRDFKVKESWTDAWTSGAHVRLELNGQHGPCLGKSQSANSGWGAHTCSKRNCCGTNGVGGIW
jgi:hypothetical protein